MSFSFVIVGVGKRMGTRMEENRGKWLSVDPRKDQEDSISSHIYSSFYRLFGMSESQVTSYPHPLLFGSYFILYSIIQ